MDKQDGRKNSKDSKKVIRQKYTLTHRETLKKCQIRILLTLMTYMGTGFKNSLLSMIEGLSKWIVLYSDKEEIHSEMEIIIY